MFVTDRWRFRLIRTASRAGLLHEGGSELLSRRGSSRVTVPKKGGTITHVLAQDAATLVYLAGQNVVSCITGSRARTIRAFPTV